MVVATGAEPKRPPPVGAGADGPKRFPEAVFGRAAGVLPNSPPETGAGVPAGVEPNIPPVGGAEAGLEPNKLEAGAAELPNRPAVDFVEPNRLVDGAEEVLLPKSPLALPAVEAAVG